MRLTDGQFWGGMAITVLFQIALAVGFIWHWRKVDRDILRDDRKRLNAWAHRYARLLARDMLRDYLCRLKVDIPVTLINESDIDWGERK